MQISVTVLVYYFTSSLLYLDWGGRNLELLFLVVIFNDTLLETFSKQFSKGIFSKFSR